MSYNLKSTPQQYDPIKIEYPFAGNGDMSHKVVFVPTLVEIGSYAPIDLNTFSASVYHTGDINLTTETGILKFDRTYANIPSSRIEYETYAYTFPGVVTQRKPFSKTVTLQVTYDYFLIGVSGSYSTAASIPVIGQTEYTYPGYFGPVDPSEFYLAYNSTPTYTDYFSNTGSFSIVAEPSTLKRYRGNIYERATKRVRAI